MLTDGRTDGRTENRTPISHPATSRCDKNIHIPWFKVDCGDSQPMATFTTSLEQNLYHIVPTGFKSYISLTENGRLKSIDIWILLFSICSVRQELLLSSSIYLSTINLYFAVIFQADFHFLPRNPCHYHQFYPQFQLLHFWFHQIYSPWYFYVPLTA